MKFAHAITLTVFARLDEEDVDKVKEKLTLLAPIDLAAEKVQIQEQTAISFNERKIKIYTLRLEKHRHIEAFLDFLSKNLTLEQKEMLLHQKESRLDEHLSFFMRFDKEQWMREGKLWITDDGNCFHLRIHLAAFPKKREVGLGMIESFFIIPQT
ncbi:hypothetical protein HZB01_03115 [Candidatus Woesearchaeota archaeon]|nr:hypothetical protein [Candidatus Woesearchaeota archaeon]